MSYFLTGLFAAMIGGCFAACVMAALQINRRENREDDQCGAPEGAILHHSVNGSPLP